MQNDAPTITVTDPAAVTEGNTGTPAPMTVTIANQVAISDVDSNDVQTKYVAGTLAFDAAHSSGHGVSASQFTLNTATGTISYDKAAFDYLSGGETVVAKFTFNASSGPDTQTKTITLTINGAERRADHHGHGSGRGHRGQHRHAGPGDGDDRQPGGDQRRRQQRRADQIRRRHAGLRRGPFEWPRRFGLAVHA